MSRANTNAAIAVAGIHIAIAFSLGLGVIVKHALSSDDGDFSVYVLLIALSVYPPMATLASVFGAALASPNCDSTVSGLVAGLSGAVIGSTLAIIILIVFVSMAGDEIQLGDLLENYFKEIFLAEAITNGGAGLGGAFFGRFLAKNRSSEPSSLYAQTPPEY